MAGSMAGSMAGQANKLRFFPSFLPSFLSSPVDSEDTWAHTHTSILYGRMPVNHARLPACPPWPNGPTGPTPAATNAPPRSARTAPFLSCWANVQIRNLYGFAVHRLGHWGRDTAVERVICRSTRPPKVAPLEPIGFSARSQIARQTPPAMMNG